MLRTRVLVVEDSLTIRRYLVQVLAADPEIEVVGETGDGKTAIEECGRLRPDVITLDMMLPVMSGLAATEYIMAYCPTPILIVSASTNRGELFRMYEALAAGAVDVLEKPLDPVPGDAWEERFRSQVKMIARIKVITHPRAKRRLRPASLPLPDPSRIEPDEHCRVVAIGASTGGPGALVRIFQQLPADFPVPILLVIHIGRTFAQAFIEWLAGQSPIPVTCAADGPPIPPVGQVGVLVAPADRHLVVREGRIRLTDDPERHSCRPSVDLLFESLAGQTGPRTVACLLTGMGCDGARGLLAIRQAGGTTLAQDEATSVVYGMPREAVQMGAVERVLPLDQIAPTLISLAGRRGSRRE